LLVVSLESYGVHISVQLPHRSSFMVADEVRIPQGHLEVFVPQDFFYI
jgi:hypothetical protein